MTTVELRVDTLAKKLPLPDEPGDMEHRIERAITRAAAELSAYAAELGAVFLPGAATVRVHVEVSQRAVVVPEELDVEEIRRAVEQVPQPVYHSVLYDLPTEERVW